MQDAFHLSKAAAETYEIQKVPLVFAPLAKATLGAVDLMENARVLDIACGTGIMPRLLAERIPGRGRIVGTDLNPAMIEVAQRLMPESQHRVDWFTCDVVGLPFEDREFDFVFCQQGLQFFPDKPSALAEIRRVLVPGGRLVLTCWRKVSPLFQAVADSLKKHVSEKSAEQALTPFSFRDAEVISSLLTAAGFNIKGVSNLLLHRPLRPPRPAIRKEILASPYEEELLAKGESAIDAVISDVELALAPHRKDGNLVVPQESSLFLAEKSGAK